eukprot:TRINITY_DN5006_c1_g1_i1.p1 TRINITY_DN5006_c1_g1~~TRINITY_DN5006_c1_g1_i1.p1  ORF type:complete len:419 (-),score=252.41 TRINITY_DN5006_c1_g1_i1:67-1323(-)
MSQLLRIFLLLALLFALSSAEIFFQEEFGEGWEQRWVLSKSKDEESRGVFTIDTGKYHGDVEASKGLKTSQDAKFYQISAEFKEFSNEDKPLILQYSVKHEQNIDCGGGYIKILPAGVDQENFNGDSPYNVMFGPDICGNTKRVHAILTHKEVNHLIKTPDILAESDQWTHLYTFIINPDQTFEVKINGKSIRSGSIPDHWDILPPKDIRDPSISKPADWVEQREIDDPTAVKPEGWDDIPQQIADADAKIPEDWDLELDGEWEAPQIDNPEYKGAWVAPRIANPEYKGEWIHPMIPNPDFHEDPSIAKYKSNKLVGIEIWQVKAGTIFDNILITDSVETAEEWAQKTLQTKKEELAMKDAESAKLKAEAAVAGDNEESNEDAGEFNLGDAFAADDDEDFEDDNVEDDDDEENENDEL